MAVKCIVHMHITAELKAYWLLAKLIAVMQVYVCVCVC